MNLSKSKPLILFLFSVLAVAALYAVKTPVAQAAVCNYTNQDGNVDGGTCAIKGGDGQNCVAIGRNWFYQKICILDAKLQDDSKVCYGKRLKFDGVTGCTNTCNVQGEILCGASCKAPAPPADCDAKNRNTDACTSNCTSCKPGFSEWNGQCVASCNAATELRLADGSCLPLETVSYRARSFYRLIQKISTLPQNINNLLQALMEGDPAQAKKNFDDLNTALNALQELTVKHAELADAANTANTLKDKALEFADFGMVCANDQVTKYSNNTWGCGYAVPGGSIQTGQLADGAVTTPKIADLNVTTAKIADLNVTTGKIADSNVTTVKIADKAITYNKLDDPLKSKIDQIGSASLFVGVSSGVPNGSLGGYKNANDKCSLDVGLPESHICTMDEIIRTYVNDPNKVGNAVGRAWINNGPPGYTQNIVNDCAGWQSAGSGIFGSIWIFDNQDKSSITPCDQVNLPFACCK